MLIIDTYTILIWLVAVIIGSLGIVIYAGSKNVSSKLFVILLISDFLWTIIVGANRSAATQELSDFLSRLSYFLGLLISASFLYFCLGFYKNKFPDYKIAISLIVLLSIFVPLFFYTDLILAGSFYVGGIARWGWSFGPLWFLFDLFFNIAFFIGLFILYQNYKKTSLSLQQKHLKFMFWSMAIAVIPASIVGVILPRFGYYEVGWLSPITGLGWVTLISYSIARYREMDVKALLVEVFILVMAVVLFVNIFLGDSLGVVGRGIVFTVFILIGYSFIKNILKEAVLTEKLKDLNENLEEKVEQQAGQVQKAYEVEKGARIELEKLNEEKDRFLLATQHNLRTPLTVIKGYIDVALAREKDPESRRDLEQAAQAGNQMTQLLNSVLEVSESRVKNR